MSSQNIRIKNFATFANSLHKIILVMISVYALNNIFTIRKNIQGNFRTVASEMIVQDRLSTVITREKDIEQIHNEYVESIKTERQFKKSYLLKYHGVYHLDELPRNVQFEDSKVSLFTDYKNKSLKDFHVVYLINNTQEDLRLDTVDSKFFELEFKNENGEWQPGEITPLLAYCGNSFYPINVPKNHFVVYPQSKLKSGQIGEIRYKTNYAVSNVGRGYHVGQVNLIESRMALERRKDYLKQILDKKTKK